MIVVDYFILRKRKLDLRSAYFLEGHDAYEFTKGFNLVGLSCVFISLLVAVLFVYNPVTAQIQSPIFLITTGSGFTALFGGLLYWLASLSPLKRYMIKRSRHCYDLRREGLWFPLNLYWHFMQISQIIQNLEKR